jgi:hypothetical protein
MENTVIIDNICNISNASNASNAGTAGNIGNVINTSKHNECDIPFNSINYLTLEIMANTESYNKYLKKNNIDHDTALKKEKRFYRKRIISMTKDILFNNNSGADVNNNINTITPSKLDDVILNAFNTYAKVCISYFKFKDTMDTIQGEYKNMNLDACIGVDTNASNDIMDINEANKLFMRQMEKKVLTLDNFVIKTSPPQDEMVIPQTKDFNLKDPKYKKKDIKKFSKNKPALNHLTTDGINVIINKKDKSEIELSIDAAATANT